MAYFDVGFGAWVKRSERVSEKRGGRERTDDAATSILVEEVCTIRHAGYVSAYLFFRHTRSPVSNTEPDPWSFEPQSQYTPRTTFLTVRMPDPSSPFTALIRFEGPSGRLRHTCPPTHRHRLRELGSEAWG